MVTRKIKMILFFLATMIFTSCSNEDVKKNEFQQSFTDKEIFKGLFMGMGKVAASIPSIDNQYVEKVFNNLTSEEQQLIEIFISDIYEELKTNRSIEFNKFIQAMKSGDNSLISKQLVEFGNTYYSSLQNSLKYGEYFLQAKEELSKINKVDILDETGNFDEAKFSSILEKESIKLTSAKSKELMTNEEVVTTLGAAPVICFTLIVWNYGVIVNAAAAVNAAIGVNVVVLCYVGAGDDCFGGGDDGDNRDGPLPSGRSSRILEREMLINDISLALNQ